MIISKRQRIKNMGHETVKTEKKIAYNFDINVLVLFCSYVLSENKNIKRGHLINLRNLIAIMDMEVYSADPERKKLIEFINRGLDARINLGLKDKKLILQYISGGLLIDNIDEKLNDFAELSNLELDYINDTINGALSCMVIENEMDGYYQLYTKYKAQDYRYRADMVKDIKNYTSSVHNKFREIDSRGKMNTMFSFDPNTVEDTLSDIYDTITYPNRFLRCQMQGVNTMFGGGFEATRFYLLVGTAGVGKSLLVLNLAMQMKKANKGCITKDPTKKPTIIVLTQENSMEETVERLFTIVSGYKMANFSKEEVYKILMEDGECTLTDENNINIHIIYKPDRSIDTSDLYTIIEDLEDDGYETIALFQDHIKRIRSVEHYSDTRLELGAVVNEMKTVAILKQIPVFSIAHLNRDAAKVTDENITGNKIDLTRLLGRSNIGESMLMIDNSDAVVIIGEEFDSEGNRYIAFNLVKLRYAEMILKFICYPYDNHNKIKIQTDDHLPLPIFRETMRPDNALANMVNGSPMKSSSYNNISMLEEENIFSNIKLTNVADTFDELSMGNNIEKIKIVPGTNLIEEYKCIPNNLVSWI